MTRLFDSKGLEISLGPQIARGGEGIVYEIQGNTSHVAKIYSTVLTDSKRKKLTLLPQIASSELLSISSWPTDLLYDNYRNIKGFIMPKIKGREIHDLYNPAGRKLYFPTSDWRFLIHVARNLAAAVDTVHSHGHVIGDLNQKGIFVLKQGFVSLIDCDSFQIRYLNQYFLCDVGVCDFTPPEMQEKHFKNVVRTFNHDNFGLAVLCFQLLFLGRHPFAGRYNVKGDISLEKAIRDYLFVYSNSANSKNLSPPPNTLPLSNVSSDIAILFERAFSKEAASNGNRPLAKEWVKSLDKISSELRTCNLNNAHIYHTSLVNCPWCLLEMAVGPIFVPNGTFNITQVWQKVLSVPVPIYTSPPSFNVNTIIGTPLSQSIKYAKHKRIAIRTISVIVTAITMLNIDFFGGLAIYVIIGLIIMNIKAFKYDSNYNEERTKRTASLHEAQKQWDDLKKQWDRETGDILFQSKLQELKSKKTQYEKLSNMFQEEKMKLEANREFIQKKHHLEGFLIDKANLNGIGANLKKVLASYGIKTANDITKEIQFKVPNFGPVRTRELLQWRSKAANQFKFDSKKGCDPAEVVTLNNKYNLLKKQFEEELKKGPTELNSVGNSILLKKNDLTKRLEVAALNLAKASADVKVL